MSLKSKIVDFVAKSKVYFARATAYVSILNFLMIMATFKISYGLPVSNYVIIPAGFLFIVILGYLDYKLIFKHQVIHINKKNDIKQQLDRIEKMLGEKNV